ncbi:hypothetical protein GCM10022600_15270 [Qipengyuania pelagi]|uniref:Uncharacterized protein n=1 Tax=Qipengyuania pelagi TaxID=994320 RepID=A0A844Y9C4_9SPHN|nr:hypothetical protein [Qipengyuania pelagi]MXO53618.1 hypothetical protein [Qipengyuania pelagi]
MSEHVKLRYPTKAQVEHAIRMAKLAGIDRIGSIELGPDGTIRLAAPGEAPAPASIEDEIARWREGKGR